MAIQTVMVDVVGPRTMAVRSDSTARATSVGTRRPSLCPASPRHPTGRRVATVAATVPLRRWMTRPWRRRWWSSAAWRPLPLRHAPHCHPHSINTRHRRPCHPALCPPTMPLTPPPSPPLPTHPWCLPSTACHAVTRLRCRCPARQCLRCHRRSCVPATWRTHRPCPEETPPRKWVSNTPLLRWPSSVSIELKIIRII